MGFWQTRTHLYFVYTDYNIITSSALFILFDFIFIYFLYWKKTQPLRRSTVSGSIYTIKRDREKRKIMLPEYVLDSSKKKINSGISITYAK